MLERLQKILSARGIASRRKAEEYIELGLVLVNGKPAVMGQKADPDVDLIEVKGDVLSARQDMLYYLFAKPAGVITSNVDRSEDEPGKEGRDGAQSSQSEKPKDPYAPIPPLAGFEITKSALERLKSRKTGRKSQRPEDMAPTVRDLLPAELQGKVFPVGRLDKDSEGLLLLTNDGVVAYRLTHPKFDHEKEYEVVVANEIKDGALRKLYEGVMIDSVKTKPAIVKRLSPTSFRITLTEGRYRQIRRMCQKVGSEVVRLTRVRIMNLTDSSLAPGAIRPLTEAEKSTLLTQIGVPGSGKSAA